jgi:predicted nucleic acid-binding protein
MSAAVDTNILLDILLPDPIYKESSLDLLTKYLKTDKLIISEIVYAELASQFTDKRLLRS